VLQEHVGAVPAAAAIFQPRPSNLPKLLRLLLHNADDVLARGAEQV